MTTPILEVQKFLRQFEGNQGLAALEEKYSIKARRHREFPNVVLLKYNQIESVMTEPVVQECRGVILDESENWAVINYGYGKFFNSAELSAAPIDWTTARVMEKEDGSLLQLFFYKNEWQVATSGTPDAEGPVNSSGMTFKELIWSTWKLLGYSLPPETFKHYCFQLELLTKFNRIVVPISKPRIVLHGVRNLETLKEESPEDFATKFGWELIRSYPLRNLAEVLKAAEALTPDVSEGYVVRDASFNRIKIKSPTYVAMAHIRDNMSVYRMLEIVRTNEGSEFLAHFPEWQNLHDEIRSKFNGLMAELEQTWSVHHTIENQKDFALKVKDFPWSSAFFTRRAGKVQTFREWSANIQIKNLADYLKLNNKMMANNIE